MHYHLAIVLRIPLWLLVYTYTIDALAIAPQGSISTEVHQSDSSSTFNLTYPPSLRNHTVTSPESYIPYHVSKSPVILMFHGFGPTIPYDDILRAVALAIGIAFDKIDQRGGDNLMTKGFFSYTHVTIKRDAITLSVADFRETGKPMTYYNLRDALRGVGEFFLMRKKGQELQFEIDVEHEGYRGTGHVEYKPAKRSMSAVT